MFTKKLSFPITFSVVVPAYNEEDGIEACIESILAQTLKPRKVIVVNDGSTDRTPEILEKYKDRVTVVNLLENTGNKALAMMEAIPYLEGDVVIYTDADSLLHPEAAEKMIIHFFDPRVGGVAGSVRSRKYNVVTSVRELQYFYGQELYKKGMDAVNTVTVIPGSVGAVRRELFRPSPDTITEDHDLTLSVLESGYRVVFEPNAITWTSDPPNIRSYIRQTIRWNAGFFQNLRKHFLTMPLRVKLQTIVLLLDNTLFSALLIASLAGSVYNVFLPLHLLFTESILWLIVSLFAAARLGRRDLFLTAFIMPLFRALDSSLWLYTVVTELLVGRRDMRWHRSDRFPTEKASTPTR